MKPRFRNAILFSVCAAAMAAFALSVPGNAEDDEPSRTRVAFPVIDPVEGQKLFVTEGCVICHSVNGIGGKAGPTLDAEDGNNVIDVFEFTARMWAGAFAMVELQSQELGYQFDLTGEEMAHIAGFVYDRKQQLLFKESDVPDLIRDMFIKTRYELGTEPSSPPK